LQVDFGAVVVNTLPLRNKLIATQKDLVARLGKVVQAIPRDIMLAASRKYKDLQANLLQTPKDIEGVDQQRKFIESLPNKIQAIVEEMEAAQPWCAQILVVFILVSHGYCLYKVLH
jgi:dynein heavy chain, axonemal